MKNFKLIVKNIEWEGVLWLTGLVYLFIINPYHVQTYSFCPYHNLGIDFCPGCGLGRSISLLYHADFINSFKAHPLGIFALVMISYRIIKLSIKTYHNFHKTNEVIYG